MYTEAHVIRLANLPRGQQDVILRRIPVSHRVELIKVARQMQARGVSGLGKSFFSKIGDFLKGAVKTVTGVVGNVLGGGSQVQPVVVQQAAPAAPETPAWVAPVAIGGGVLLLVMLMRRPSAPVVIGGGR